jgi:UDP-glucose 4-epimerase
MPSYLVTGGAGFIGSHLCDALLARGDRVRVLDDLSTGKHANLPREAELIIGDIADPVAVRDAVADMDGCFHLAAVPSVARGIDDWLGTHRANLTGTVTLLDAVRHRPVPVIYASSAAVYGDCPLQPISENSPTRPLSAYGADKLGSELHAHVATHVHRIPTTGLRFFNVYGPRQDPNSPYSGVISIFCERLQRRLPIDIHGEGRQTRDFIYVGDVVAALLAAMDRQRNGADLPRVMNICTGEATSVLELARLIANLAGQKPEIRHGPPRPGDISASIGSPKLARDALALSRTLPLGDGLARVLHWLRRSS